ncbi:MAG: cytochrome c oxidase assembly protein [Marmoricola sp.]
MTPPPYSFAQAFSAWHFDGYSAGFVLLLGVLYAWGLSRAARRDAGWPWWRSAAFVVLGLGGIVICTMSSLAVYQRTVAWAFAIQVTLLMTVVPVALAAGDPVGLLRAGCSPPARERWDRALQGRLARVITFPLVAAILGVVVQMTLFFGPFLRPALQHSWAMAIVYLVALVAGCLLAWPLLGDDLLPAWCTPGLRMLFAALDGLLDAIPGIALTAAGTLIAGGYFRDHRPPWIGNVLGDQHLAGGLAVALSEVVAIPLLVMLFFRWARSETPRRSAAVDGGEARPTPGSSQEPVLERPWWETEQGFGRRTEEYRGREGR